MDANLQSVTSMFFAARDELSDACYLMARLPHRSGRSARHWRFDALRL